MTRRREDAGPEREEPGMRRREDEGPERYEPGMCRREDTGLGLEELGMRRREDAGPEPKAEPNKAELKDRERRLLEVACGAKGGRVRT
ncbi:hypothetical protein NDU88_003833 [Pleurodeles waltl]|uniref:Uncharacterized protein n=1 Tax=Pleurodeles waltl TaxID=8319 RepID=A0AAV7KXK9_PLEWA|nr:hypothetical protein NDU88_003833 [Pleurodeles waltl]